jgi:hypothetical protein
MKGNLDKRDGNFLFLHNIWYTNDWVVCCDLIKTHMHWSLYDTVFILCIYFFYLVVVVYCILFWPQLIWLNSLPIIFILHDSEYLGGRDSKSSLVQSLFHLLSIIGTWEFHYGHTKRSAIELLYLPSILTCLSDGGVSSCKGPSLPLREKPPVAEGGSRWCRLPCCIDLALPAYRVLWYVVILMSRVLVRGKARKGAVDKGY